MQGFRQSLPPLDLLVAFEAAARHASFTRAAEELNITQSAVSQQIRHLESSLGLALFERGHRSVRLSAAGQEFYNSVSLALSHLSSAANRLKVEREAPRLTLATDESVAAMWLSPRLADFRQAHPEIALQLIASDRREDCFREEVDLAILHGDGRWPGYDCEPLFAEEVFPVCAPGYLEENPEASSLEGLSRASLLDLEYESWSWMNWSIWLTEKGLGLPTAQQIMRSNNYPLLIDCARQGQGVALGWRYFVDDDLLAGRLVIPVMATVRTRYAYYLVRKHNQPEKPRTETLAQWILARVREQRLHPMADSEPQSP